MFSPEYFLDSFELIGDMLCKLFNFIFHNNLYPECWTKGLIIPVPQKVDLANVHNYRGVTVISILVEITDKTKAMLFTCSNRQEHFEVFYGNVTLSFI